MLSRLLPWKPLLSLARSYDASYFFEDASGPFGHAWKFPNDASGGAACHMNGRMTPFILVPLGPDFTNRMNRCLHLLPS